MFFSIKVLSYFRHPIDCLSFGLTSIFIKKNLSILLALANLLMCSQNLSPPCPQFNACLCIRRFPQYCKSMMTSQQRLFVHYFFLLSLTIALLFVLELIFFYQICHSFLFISFVLFKIKVSAPSIKAFWFYDRVTMYDFGVFREFYLLYAIFSILS